MNEIIRIILENQNPWWFGKKFYLGIKRISYLNYLEKYLDMKEILFLIGVRRTGKSTLMYQLIDLLLKKGVNSKSILFINLDNPYLRNNSNIPNLITDIVENYLIENKDIKKLYLFIDEIQTFNFWSESLKYIYDLNLDIKIVASGSSSNLIESKLAVKLSGRYFYKNIFPLDFNEYLYFNNLKKLKILEYKIKFKKYFQFGGFPRVVLEKDMKIKSEILKNYFQTIYMKDIILPNNIRNNNEVYNLLFYLVSNISKLYSYSNLSKILNLSVDTIKDYIEFAIKTYIISNLTIYDKSIKKQLVNPKKIYVIDTGLANAVSFKFSEDYGRQLENLVFIELKRRGKEIYYHKQKKECDFVIKEGLEIVEAIQVCKSLSDIETKEREIAGLLDACKTYNLKEGIILTDDEEGEEERSVKVENGDERKVRIKTIPIWKWLLIEN